MNTMREQRTVFGEVADEYDAIRPSYPDDAFEAVITFGGLAPGDRALEIGAGTGKATEKVLERGLRVHALEPSPGMANILRRKLDDVDETTFEAWPLQPGAFRLVYAAQAWHWVHGADRYEKVAAALAPGGTFALIWNVGRDHPEPFKETIEQAYRKFAPDMVGGVELWRREQLLGEFATCAAFEPVVEHTFTWECMYPTAEWVRMIGTASNHRMLPDDVRGALLGAVGAAIDQHGGALPVVYDTLVYLSRRS
jgi:SAM-dependent methyltransferase